MQAESLKQYRNDARAPRTARLLTALKDAIGDDVAQATGSDIY
jgi:hypothetical protein